MYDKKNMIFLYKIVCIPWKCWTTRKSNLRTEKNTFTVAAHSKCQSISARTQSGNSNILLLYQYTV